MQNLIQTYLEKNSELRFRVFIYTDKTGEKKITDIMLFDPENKIKKDKKIIEELGKPLVSEFIRTDSDGGMLISSVSKRVENGFIVDLESLEERLKIQGNIRQPVCSLILKVSLDSEDINQIFTKNRLLNQENLLLKKENEELINLVEKIEGIKESYRVPFDAIKDLIISFDCQGHVLVVNSASKEWFGQTPKEIVRKKYKTILKQDIMYITQSVCSSGKSLFVEEKIGDKVLQITYIPMINKKNGKTEVVMLAQDITHRKKEEEKLLKNGRDEGVMMMGGTIRHILNSSLHAILGFAQLALSSYEWPRETMIKYLKLIERTALRMKREISKIAEQKEYKTTKYVHIEDVEDCKEIIAVELEEDYE